MKIEFKERQRWTGSCDKKLNRSQHCSGDKYRRPIADETPLHTLPFPYSDDLLALSIRDVASGFLDINGFQILNLKSPLIEKAIFKSCSIKKKVVETDEKEMGIRKILNFGHTFAHAYEASLGYAKKLNHGEAVILGMKTALSFSLKNNLLLKNDYNSIINHISKTNLPSKLKKFFRIKDLNKILSFMVKDKKNNSDKINLVLLKKIGSPMIDKEYSKNSLSVFLKNELGN